MSQLLARIDADGKPMVKDDSKISRLSIWEKNNAINEDEVHAGKMTYGKEGRMMHLFCFVF